MKREIMILLTLVKVARAQPTGDVIEIPVVKSMEDVWRNYSLFVGTVLSLIVIVFIALMIKIYRKRRREKREKEKKKKK
jgi:heme/copper-type cytochrome/quinol oxidase subunit 2